VSLQIRGDAVVMHAEMQLVNQMQRSNTKHMKNLADAHHKGVNVPAPKMKKREKSKGK
jgi:hypothetical protein